jgi:putative hydrolase of the HAD superfamily
VTTTVYFDLDGTLLEYATGFDELFARTLPVPATPAATETYGERVLAALREGVESPFERAFAATCDAHDVDADPAALAAEYVDREVAATRLPPSVERLVAAVARQHSTGVLTNGDGHVQRRKLAAHGLDDLVDAVVVSNEVGSWKPDPGIFDLARERLPADTHVYVGDSPEEDVRPARERGFVTVHVGDGDAPAAHVSAADAEALAAVLLPLLDEERE